MLRRAENRSSANEKQALELKLVERRFATGLVRGLKQSPMPFGVLTDSDYSNPQIIDYKIWNCLQCLSALCPPASPQFIDSVEPELRNNVRVKLYRSAAFTPLQVGMFLCARNATGLSAMKRRKRRAPFQIPRSTSEFRFNAKSKMGRWNSCWSHRFRKRRSSSAALGESGGNSFPVIRFSC